ncbi:MAG: hypothetical protein EOP45_04440 [Sphingobacteriaceae bacterium]|nr:MAG: hypothetical protein EOP45_04440 [Sphingobacteriaceae bacterium]
MSNDSIPRKRVRWYEIVQINGCIIRFKLDSGADWNVLPYRYLKKMKNVKLQKYDGPVTAYDNNALEIMGMVELVVMCRNEISVQKFLVMDTQSEPLLGLEACLRMNLIKRIDVLEDPRAVFIEKNRDVFDGLGCFVKNLDMKVREGSVPVYKPARRFAIALRQRVKKKSSIEWWNKK